jgi:hypothetical protein
MDRVTCPRGVWTEISGEMVVSDSYNLQTNESVPFVVCEKATEPTDTDSRILVDIDRHYILPVRYLGTKFWVRPKESDRNLVVVEIVKAGGIGQPVLSVDSRGSLETIKQDQFTEIIDLHLSRDLDTITLLDDYSVDDRTIEVETTGAVPVAGNLICLKEQTSFYQGEILTVTPIAGNQYTLYMDTPLDFGYTIAGGCALRDKNAAVDGSITPVVFSVGPEGLAAETQWDITRMLFAFRGDGYGTPPDNNPDDAGFGTMEAITNGIYFRSVDGVTKNIFAARTNFDIANHAYDLTYVAANKIGEFGVRCRRSFNGDDKNGVTIRLSADTADEFQLIVQDDLTAMTEFSVVIQGHVVE